MARTIQVYLEAGTRRTFAGALDWPGWCRSGRDEASALQALLEYASRYADVLRSSGVSFTQPKTLSDPKVIERLKGGSGTDFGAPQAHPASDNRKMDSTGLKRSQAQLRACWAALDATAAAARGKALAAGPRGGGRTLPQMLEHVPGAEEAYLEKLGWWNLSGETQSKDRGTAQVRQAALQAVRASAAGEIPAVGPRVGQRWSPRYCVRRAAWHVLDHAWEIEDRLAQTL
jgi:hypothetical protein